MDFVGFRLLGLRLQGLGVEALRFGVETGVEGLGFRVESLRV